MFSAHNFSKTKKQTFQSGQGILEVIVTIGIGTIMLLALVILSVQANRASDFSKANSQAANLASEGIEIIHNIKSRSFADSSLTAINYSGDCTSGVITPLTWLQLYEQDLDETTIPCSDATNGALANIGNVSGYTLDIQTTITASNVAFAGRNFTRAVYIADSPGKSNCNQNIIGQPGYDTDFSTLKQFTVVVTWDDSSGTHQSTQSDCIGINENTNG